MRYDGVIQKWVYNCLGVHEVATAYGAILYENIFVIVPGLVFILLVVRFKFCFYLQKSTFVIFYCGLENYSVWHKPFACKFVVLTPVLCLLHIQTSLTFVLLAPFCACVDSKILTVSTT